MIRLRLQMLAPRNNARAFSDSYENGPTLSIFGFRDHGALLKVYGLERKAIQYDIDNPLTASQMTRHQLSAGLYAPIRVLLREYDRPKSVFGQFNDAGVNALAEKLDRDLQVVLQKDNGCGENTGILRCNLLSRPVRASEVEQAKQRASWQAFPS